MIFLRIAIMKQRHNLFSLLKSQLRAHGITYKILGEKLHLSEASIKRMFSLQDLDLSRLEEISACMNFSLTDLFNLLEKEKKHILHLTQAQEKELVTELELLLVTICILNHWLFEDILHYYDFSEHALIRYAARLDKMKIIELQPNNRFKRLVSADFHWLPDGPIQQFFQKNIQNELFSCNFNKSTELLLVRSGMLSEQDNFLFQQALLKTAQDFIKLCRDTVDLPIEQRQGTALMIAMRPWVPQIFDHLRRKPE